MKYLNEKNNRVTFFYFIVISYLRGNQFYFSLSELIKYFFCKLILKNNFGVLYYK